MRQADVERWVVEVLNRLERGERVEDDRVELKRTVPTDPRKVARRIAGHANQVREDRILWVIGATDDPDTADRIPGVPPGSPDLGDWWPQVEAVFEEVAPSPVFVSHSHQDRTVIGIGFMSDRTPYVIKVHGDAPNREVPWREGTRVRSANRIDLLRVLVPASERPLMTVLGGSLWVKEEEGKRWRWGGSMAVYVETAVRLVIPDHLCTCSVDFGAGPFEIEVFCSTPQRTRFPPPGLPDPVSVVNRGEAQLLIDTHSKMNIVFTRETDFFGSKFAAGAKGTVSVQIATAGMDRQSIRLEARLEPVHTQPHMTAEWGIRS